MKTKQKDIDHNIVDEEEENIRLSCWKRFLFATGIFSSDLTTQLPSGENQIFKRNLFTIMFFLFCMGGFVVMYIIYQDIMWLLYSISMYLCLFIVIRSMTKRLDLIDDMSKEDKELLKDTYNNVLLFTSVEVVAKSSYLAFKLTGGDVPLPPTALPSVFLLNIVVCFIISMKNLTITEAIER